MGHIGPVRPRCPIRPIRKASLRPAAVTKTFSASKKRALIYDATVCFCKRFVDRRSRTCDQMVQAARSGKQTSSRAARPVGRQNNGTQPDRRRPCQPPGVARGLQRLPPPTSRSRMGQESQGSRYLCRFGTRHGVTFEDFRPFIATRPPRSSRTFSSA
jgi:hypothetical protein